jgi:hypothetical protein
MQTNYKNKNRGYQQLRVWQDAIDVYVLNNLSFKLENGLLKLVESLEHKQETGDWIDSLIIKESNAAYG